MTIDWPEKLFAVHFNLIHHLNQCTIFFSAGWFVSLTTSHIFFGSNFFFSLFRSVKSICCVNSHANGLHLLDSDHTFSYRFFSTSTNCLWLRIGPIYYFCLLVCICTLSYLKRSTWCLIRLNFFLVSLVAMPILHSIVTQLMVCTFGNKFISIVTVEHHAK